MDFFKNDYLDYVRSTEKMASEMYKAQNKAQNLLNSAIMDRTKQFVEYKKTKEAMEALSAPLLNSVKQIEERQKRRIEALTTISNTGWCVDYNWYEDYFNKLTEDINSKKLQDVEEDLESYFKENLQAIEEFIVDKFPKRKKFIQDAFEAHSSGKYTLSIPVFLSQIDGMCKDVLGKYIFIEKERRFIENSKTFNRTKYSLDKDLLKFVNANLTIWKTNQKDGSKLNRHSILHGSSLEYHTKTNGLKIISFINFICQVLSLKDKVSEH